MHLSSHSVAYDPAFADPGRSRSVASSIPLSQFFVERPDPSSPMMPEKTNAGIVVFVHSDRRPGPLQVHSSRIERREYSYSFRSHDRHHPQKEKSFYFSTRPRQVSVDFSSFSFARQASFFIFPFCKIVPKQSSTSFLSTPLSSSGLFLRAEYNRLPFTGFVCSCPVCSAAASCRTAEHYHAYRHKIAI